MWLAASGPAAASRPAAEEKSPRPSRLEDLEDHGVFIARTIGHHPWTFAAWRLGRAPPSPPFRFVAFAVRLQRSREATPTHLDNGKWPRDSHAAAMLSTCRNASPDAAASSAADAAWAVRCRGQRMKNEEVVVALPCFRTVGRICQICARCGRSQAGCRGSSVASTNWNTLQRHPPPLCR